MQNSITYAIVNARIFDGVKILESTPVIVKGTKIEKIGGEAPTDAVIIDGKNCTLLPGLIDAHTHTDASQLREALRFGVTTEIEMMGQWTKEERKIVEEDDNSAAVISSGPIITPPNGHPYQLIGGGPIIPHSDTPQEIRAYVDFLVANGSDFIKIMIEEGTVFRTPGLPMLKKEVLIAAVEQTHKHGKLAVAHTLTAETTKQAIEAGIDCLAHLFLDRPEYTSELIEAIAKSGVFMTPCLCYNSAMIGNTGESFAADKRVHAKLSEQWLKTLCSSFNAYPQGKFEDSLANAADLRKAGVDLLIGTDVTAAPVPSLGGRAHGASAHHELQLFVMAGFSPLEALRCATSIPAKRFGLQDRGNIAEGARADLLLVEGDPAIDISETLNIKTIWRRGSCFRLSD